MSNINNKKKNDKKDLGLYIHIPFCVKKCDYCDFLSAPANDETKREYVQALIAEIRSYKELAKEYLVKTIFIGGGTPSTIDGKYMEEIMEAILEVFTVYGMNDKKRKGFFHKLFSFPLFKKEQEKNGLHQEKNGLYQEKNGLHQDKSSLYKENNHLSIGQEVYDDKNADFHKNVDFNKKDDFNKNEDLNKNTDLKRNADLNKKAEITIEANPGTLTEEKLQSYKKAGINRLSIGLQSADNKELKLLGRIHTFEEFEENYKLAREVGFENINIDLMSALPGQTLENWMNTLRKVVSLNPEHISAYSLILEEGTPFHEKYMEEDQDEQLDREIYATTKKYLETEGYYRYEISNYAKPGFECKHNSSYWTRVEYLGIGLGASSLINNARFHNEPDLTEYTKASSDYHNIRRDMERLVINQQMEEFMFLGLRMDKGISKNKFKEVFDKPIEVIYGSVISQCVREGLLINENDRIYLTDKGIDLSNLVMSRFLMDDFIRS